MRDKMTNILTLVTGFLNKYPPLRDSDERLAANIWYSKIENIDRLDAKDLLKLFAQGKLPSYESISRCRRKVQESNPKLRGEKWEARHKGQKKVKNEIKELEVLMND